MNFSRKRLVLSFFLLVVGSASLLFFTLHPFSRGSDVAEVEPSPILDFAIAEPEVERIEDVFPRNSTVQGVLLEFGFPPGAIHSLIQDVRPVYNLNLVVAGNRFAIERFADGTFKSFEYHIDDEEYLLVGYDSDGYYGTRHRHNFEVLVEEFYGEIQDSLWNTLVSQGETHRLVYFLHQILQWDIDFTLIQPKDSFKLIVEKKYLNGEFVKYGDIGAAQFNSGGRTFYAFLFENPETGKKRYCDEKGNAVRKAFLKVPFDFDPRITSRFSFSRYHPILKKRRPHLGVDYGAPPGTPVVASAAGAVIFAGRDGGYGKLLRIRHPNGYVTSYAHLSRIEVRVGQKVGQGQRIGRVGSTGLSTGPHLDYRVQDKRGRFVDPQKVSALPSDKPVNRRYWKEFVSVRDRLLNRLASIPEIEPFLNRVAQAD